MTAVVETYADVLRSAEAVSLAVRSLSERTASGPRPETDPDGLVELAELLRLRVAAARIAVDRGDATQIVDRCDELTATLREVQVHVGRCDARWRAAAATAAAQPAPFRTSVPSAAIAAD